MPKVDTKQPTEAQRKEFWEGCGFTVYEKDGGKIWWNYPDGSYKGLRLPPIDLNNLFKYAVPKALEEIMPEFGMDYDDALHSLIHDWMKLMRGKKDPALALFWALDKVRKESSNG